MKRIIPILFAALFGAACYSDNASPMRHGAHNKPSSVVKGKTTTDAPPATGTAPTGTGANDLAAADTTTYAQSGAQPGGAQTSPSK